MPQQIQGSSLKTNTKNEISMKDFWILNALSSILAFMKTKLMNMCNECVVAGQNLFLGPTIHLPRLEYCFQFHHSHLTNVVYYFFRTHYQKEQ